MKTFIQAALAAILLCGFAIGAEKSAAIPKPEGTTEITIKLGDLSSSEPALSKLLNTDMPVKTSWALRKTVATVRLELQRFNEERDALYKKYGKFDKETGNTAILPENREAFSADMKKLLAIEVKISILPVSISTLGDQVKMSPVEMERLEQFIAP